MVCFIKDLKNRGIENIAYIGVHSSKVIYNNTSFEYLI